MPIILIACTDINNGIADKDGNLLFKFPKDLKRFKEITTNKHTVMGRKTWESLPIKPLPKRKNYILTSDENYEVKGNTKILHDIGEILEMAKQRDVYVIGGGELYRQLIDYADVMLLTQVHVIDHNARVFFPEYDVREWKIVSHEKHEPDKKKKKDDKVKHPHSFAFVRYERQISRHQRELMELETLAKIKREEEKASEEQNNQEN